MDELNKWLSISQVAEKVNIPAETVRRYARQYGDYLYLKRGEKRSYLIHESSLDTVKKIRYLLNNGNQQDQVMEILSKTEILNVQVDDEETNEYMMNLPQLQREMNKEIHKLSEENKELIATQHSMLEEMKVYKQLLQAQQASIDEWMDEQGKKQEEYEKKRDQSLMQVMNELMETRKEIASAKENKSIWARLFGK